MISEIFRGLFFSAQSLRCLSRGHSATDVLTVESTEMKDRDTQPGEEIKRLANETLMAGLE
jgi:hypothetical protein